MNLGVAELRQALCFFMCRQVGNERKHFFLELLQEEAKETLRRKVVKRQQQQLPVASNPIKKKDPND